MENLGRNAVYLIPDHPWRVQYGEQSKMSRRCLGEFNQLPQGIDKKENEKKLNYYQYQWSCRQRVVHWQRTPRFRYLSHRREGDKMVDPTLDPFLTTSYFPLKLPSRLISVYSQNWTSFLFHVVKSCCALWTGGAWRLFKRLLKSAHLCRRTFKLSVARLPKTTHFLVVTRLVSHWPTNSTRFVKKLLNA